MAAKQFVVAKGRIIELANRVINSDPATSDFVVALYKTLEADATLITRATKALVDANNTECDFINYTTDGEVLTTLAISTASGEAVVTSDDVQWAAAGGATNNHILKAILYYAEDTASMSAAIPLSWHTFDITTKAVNLNLLVPSSGWNIN